VTFDGAYLRDDTVAVQPGWNLVGSISASVDTGVIASDPPGIKASPWYGFNGGYAPALEIQPGRAYWVKASAAGSFILSTTATAPFFRPMVADGLTALNSVTVTDARGMSQTLWFGQDGQTGVRAAEYAMPPSPPAGVLDARFESVEGGSLVRLFPAAGEGRGVITVSADATPLRVSWNVTGGTARYALSDGRGGSIDLAGEGEMRLAGGMQRLVLTSAPGAGVPDRFALDQNYPNPFNPVTTLRYSVPVSGRVTLRVFNVLGQEVRTLVDDMQEPGVKSVTWDATNAAGQPVGSGVYFYKLEGTGFSMTRKMMLLR
jgi:hypothetical protein